MLQILIEVTVFVLKSDYYFQIVFQYLSFGSNYPKFRYQVQIPHLFSFCFYFNIFEIKSHLSTKKEKQTAFFQSHYFINFRLPQSNDLIVPVKTCYYSGRMELVVSTYFWFSQLKFSFQGPDLQVKRYLISDGFCGFILKFWLK